MNIRLSSSLLLIAVLNVSTAAWSAEDGQMQRWMSMQREVVSARDVLNGEVSSGFSPIGEVRDLVLTPDSKRVQYVLYEVPYPYSFSATRTASWRSTRRPSTEERDVEDMLIEPGTGRVAHYVIASQPDSLFNEMPMAVPADRVAVSPEGQISSDLALEDLSGMQLYPAELL